MCACMANGGARPTRVAMTLTFSFSRSRKSRTISVRFLPVASSNAVLPFCDREGGGGRGGGRPREKAGAARRERRRGACAGAHPHLRPFLRPTSSVTCTPPTPPSPAVAHLVLEARVCPRLEQRLDAGSLAVESREVQCRVITLRPHTHAGEAQPSSRGGGRLTSRRLAPGWRSPGLWHRG